MGELNKRIGVITQKKSGVTRLTLSDFRNYPTLRIDVGINPIVLTGENGSGKTNILEALSFLAPGRGLRSAKLANILRIGSTNGIGNWSVAAQILKNDEEHLLGTGIQKIADEGESDDEFHLSNRRIIKINQQKASQQSELGKYISIIWLTPQMDRLFQGGPQPRRSFLDRLVYAFDFEHAKRTANFEHLYRQWYQLIKSGCKDNKWLASLEFDMASIGVAIAAARRELIARLNTFILSEPDDVFPNVRLQLDGRIEQMLDSAPAIKVEDFYAEYLAKQREQILYNESADGVNRTDFKVFYKSKNMPAELCSTGEQKALLISIILAQTKCQILNNGFAPVLLLDEVASHLDNLKRDALLNKIVNLNLQAWITSTELQSFDVLRNIAQFATIKDNKVNFF